MCYRHTLKIASDFRLTTRGFGPYCGLDRDARDGLGFATGGADRMPPAIEECAGARAGAGTRAAAGSGVAGRADIYCGLDRDARDGLEGPSPR